MQLNIEHMTKRKVLSGFSNAHYFQCVIYQGLRTKSQYPEFMKSKPHKSGFDQ